MQERSLVLLQGCCVTIITNTGLLSDDWRISGIMAVEFREICRIKCNPSNFIMNTTTIMCLYSLPVKTAQKTLFCESHLVQLLQFPFTHNQFAGALYRMLYFARVSCSSTTPRVDNHLSLHPHSPVQQLRYDDPQMAGHQTWEVTQ